MDFRKRNDDQYCASISHREGFKKNVIFSTSGINISHRNNFANLYKKNIDFSKTISNYCLVLILIAQESGNTTSNSTYYNPPGKNGKSDEVTTEMTAKII